MAWMFRTRVIRVIIRGVTAGGWIVRVGVEVPVRAVFNFGVYATHVVADDLINQFLLPTGGDFVEIFETVLVTERWTVDCLL
jgi:hypothetical protein